MTEETKSWLRQLSQGDIFPITVAQEIDFITTATQTFRNPAIFQSLSRSEVDELILKIVIQSKLIIADGKIPLEATLAFIESCYDLFEQWFKECDSHRDSCFMFWDSLISGDWDEGALETQKEIQEAFFDCLCRILTIENERCQHSALHGFNHLRDERCKKIIDLFIAHCKNQDLIEYAKSAREFKEL